MAVGALLGDGGADVWREALGNRIAAGVEIVAGIVILDFSVGYLSHRTMHMWPVIWRPDQDGIVSQSAFDARSDT